MGRNPKVSREEALKKAMQLFWSRGYGATTLDDLQEVTGLQRGSLYSYFQTKENLFREALELYQKEIVTARRERVRKAPSAKQGIQLFFSILIDHSVQNRKNPGCLNTNTATELSLIDDSIGQKARLGLKSWEDFWVEILDRARSEGDLAKQKNTRELARLLITVTRGINVVSKINPDRTYLKGIARSGLAMIL